MIAHNLHESFNKTSHVKNVFFLYIYNFQSASHVPTQEEREFAMEEIKRRKEYEQNASEERKNFMQTMELKRKENAQPSDLEQVNYLVVAGNIHTLPWVTLIF